MEGLPGSVESGGNGPGGPVVVGVRAGPGFSSAPHAWIGCQGSIRGVRERAVDRIDRVNAGVCESGAMERHEGLVGGGGPREGVPVSGRKRLGPGAWIQECPTFTLQVGEEGAGDRKILRRPPFRGEGHRGADPIRRLRPETFAPPSTLALGRAPVGPRVPTRGGSVPLVGPASRAWTRGKGWELGVPFAFVPLGVLGSLGDFQWVS